ncbi:CPBP family intramembrane glutamic endopeptidase [Maribacter chungangensis]|uniref:CPBP family intramembrane glutamic endopeptidase n=1 Tax=Maribacter chungangensis TaxID=1069117 RepID=A0ABW3B5V9_9FLAO
MKLIIIWLLLATILYVTSLIAVNHYDWSIFIMILAYLILILYSNDFDLKRIVTNLLTIDGYERSILLLPLIVISLYGLIYSAQILLSIFLYGDTFSINLKMYIGNFKVGLLSVFIFPFIEELLFRKSILKGLMNLYSFRKSLILSSLVFALTHYFTDTSLLAVFLAGLIFGFVYNFYNSFILVFLTHALYNALVFFITPKVNENLYALDLTLVYKTIVPAMVLCFLILTISLYFTFTSKREK